MKEKMDEEKTKELTLELQEKLFGEIKGFFNEHPEISGEGIYMINGMVLTYLIVSIVSGMVNQSEKEFMLEYVDDISSLAKKALINIEDYIDGIH